MFNNVSGTIKIIAKIFCYIGIALSIMSWIVLLIAGLVYENMGWVLLGFALLIFGPLVSYINGVLLYGFGSLIENSQIVADSVPKEIDGDDTTPRFHNIFS